MESMIRFSLFGNFNKFNTTNVDLYIKLIQFMNLRSYKPAAINELQVQPNGQVRVISMPQFIGETGEQIEITSNRINFQKNIENAEKVSVFQEEFINAFENVIEPFLNEMSVVSNRVAINCDIIIPEYNVEMPTESVYFDEAEKTEMSVKNVAQKCLEGELCNIILEKYVAKNGGFTKYSYDINSVAENATLRFNGNNAKQMYEAFFATALEIEKGIK